MTQTGNTQKSKRSGLPVWVIIVIIVGCFASLGTCVWGFSGLFKAGNAARDKTDEFLGSALTEGLPKADDVIYLSEGDLIWKQPTIDRINLFLKRIGKPRAAGETMCSTISRTGTGSQNGTYATCSTPITYDATPARVTTVWKIKDEGPLLSSFNINVENEEYGHKVLSDIALIERGIDPDTLEKKEPAEPQEKTEE